jgi:hypothetical protein
MKYRRVTALTAFLTFSVMLISSIVLYIAPQGRIAYWANWTLGDLDKEQWSAIHINTGIVFLLALLFHIYINWRAIKTYLKTRDKNLKLFTKEFNLALLITITCVLGTYLKIPPFSSMLFLNEMLKDASAQTYGEPPYGHAEQSTLQAYCKKMDLDLDESVDKLIAAGYIIESSKLQIKQLAKQNNVSPQQLLLPLEPEITFTQISSTEVLPIPDELSGVGRLTLTDLNEQYNLDTFVVINGLKTQGITADTTTKLKELAEQQKINAHDLFDMIREINNQNL